MPKLPAVNGRKAKKALKLHGFYEVNSEGSHFQFKKDGHPYVVTVADHGNDDIPKGTLKNIIKTAGLTNEEFISLLNGKKIEEDPVEVESSGSEE